MCEEESKEIRKEGGLLRVKYDEGLLLEPHVLQLVRGRQRRGQGLYVVGLVTVSRRIRSQEKHPGQSAAS
jgi:hypothetical protein